MTKINHQALEKLVLKKELFCLFCTTLVRILSLKQDRLCFCESRKNDHIWHLCYLESTFRHICLWCSGGNMIYYKREYFECIIPTENRYAFYELIAGRDLFGFIVVKRWGRIGTKGQPLKTIRFSNKMAMREEFDRVYKERIKHKYKPKMLKKQAPSYAKRSNLHSTKQRPLSGIA